MLCSRYRLNGDALHLAPRVSGRGRGRLFHHHALPVLRNRQRLEKEERERRRVEKMRLKEEEKMKEETDLYDRGLSAR